VSAAAPGGAAAPRVYTILRTNQVDPYDTPMPRSAVPPIGAPPVAAPAAAKPAPVGDNFEGSKRKAAKLSLGSAKKVEVFNDVTDLIATLPSKTAMKNHVPKISNAETSGRVVEEQRNVRIRAFIYAASLEDDNDYHVIIGRDPAKSPPVFFNMEISALPVGGPKRVVTLLKKVRNTYKAFFTHPDPPKRRLPGMTYDFYEPPIPIEVEGSLYFDMPHANGEGPGPDDLRADIPTIWEIHPVTKIVFEP
jgi:hypothetical protein